MHRVLLGLLGRGSSLVVDGVAQPAEGDLVERLDQPVVLGVGGDQDVDVDLLVAVQVGHPP